MIGIYKITSPSNKVYIGQTWDSFKRFSNYKCLYCKNQTKLYNSLVKYGSNKHLIEIVYELPLDVSQEVMDVYESLYMEFYKNAGYELMNIRDSGSRGKHTEESKMKMRKPKVKRTSTHIINNKIQRMKPILQLDINGNIVKEWDCQKSLQGKFGGSVSLCLTGKRKTSGGYQWKYKYIFNNKGLTNYQNLTGINQ